MKKNIFMLFVFLSTLYNTQITAQENAPPNWAWATNVEGFESGATNNNYNIHTDKSGNSYVIDQVANSLRIAKYDANGTLLWDRPGNSGTGVVTPRDIVVDADGNYYVSGYFKDGDITFGNITLENTTTYVKDFVVKYDVNGNTVWAEKSTILDSVSNSNVYAVSLALDTNKNVYFAGYSIYYSSSSSTNVYHGRILKYNQNGVEQWNKSYYNTSGPTNFYAIDSDNFGNTYVHGYSNGKALLTKYDPFGNLVWDKTRAEDSAGIDVTVDNVGNSYVVGFINISSENTNAFVAKYDAAGNKVWEQQGVGDARDIANGVVIDDNGNVFVTGRFQHNTDFATLNVTNSNSGTSDVFVAKYDTDGNIIWVQQAGGSGADIGGAIGVDENGNCYVNGYYTVNTTFGATTLQGNGQYIPFLAKIGESAATTLVGNAIVKGENFCGGSVIVVDYAIGGKYEDDNIFTAQLSDSSGSFDTPTDIGTLESPRNTSIYAIIPLDSPKGEGYRIRVTSSSPALIGNANEIDIKINQDDCKENTNELTAKPIVAAEFFINTDPGVGSGTAILITNGISIEESFDVTLPELEAGFHSIFIRTKDEDGNWSMYDGRVFYIQPVVSVLTTTPIVAGEYFFNEEPGVGNGTALTSFESNEFLELTDQVSTNGLTEGFHNLFFRTKDANGIWSMHEGRIIYVQPEQPATEIAPIVTAEYYFNEDPGFGNGNIINTGDANETILVNLENIETSALDKGEHNIYVRVKNEDGIWSLTENSKFNICTDTLAAPEVSVANSFCAGETITLTASDVAKATSYEWSGPNNFTAKTQSITINSVSSANAGEYFVRAINDNAECKEGNTRLVDITINTTDAPEGESVQMFEEGNTIADIVINGTDVKWYTSVSDANNSTNPLATTTALVNSKTYYASQTINGCASISFLEVTISVTLSTDILYENNFKLYPNPVTNVLQIRNDSDTIINKIEIYNLLGKRIATHINPGNSVDVAQLAKGIYIVNVFSDKAKMTRRILKE
jgi:hypothetical protein